MGLTAWTRFLRPWPDFLIIGAQKGGTSSLFKYLGQHGRVRPPTVKEIHYFDYGYSRGPAWYRGHFPVTFGSGAITGEASPYYLFHPLAAARVFRRCPRTKLIVMLRNPVDRAYSHYQMEFRRGFEPIPVFEEAVEREGERLAGEDEKLRRDPTYKSDRHQGYSYLARGLYYVQIAEWLRFFPLRQFHFIRSEDFFRDPRAELAGVCRFLGLEADFPADLSPANSGSYPPLAEATRRRLDEYFRPDKAGLAGLLGERFSW